MRHSIKRAASAAALGAMLAGGAFAHPAHHQDDAKEAISLTGEELTTYQTLRSATAADPTDADAATAFARYAGMLGRRDGDDLLTKQAREALAPWADDADAPTELLTVRAALRQYDHEFRSADADLSAVLDRRPGDVQALLSRAFVRAVTGDYEGAAADCRALPMRTPPLAREACLSRAASLTGEAEPALRRLAVAVDRYGERDPQVTLFALGVLGDIAVRTGDTALADDAYSRALVIDPRSVFIQASHADLMLDEGRTDEAAALLADASDTEALLLMKARLDGAEGEAAHQLEERMRGDLAAGDHRHAREQARFALEVKDDADLALRLARENWAMQKEPIDALLLLRAADAAGRPEAGSPASEFVTRTGVQDVRFAPYLTAQAARIPGDAGG